MDLEPKEQNKIYDQIWNPIEENAKDFVRQKSLVSEYIRDYLTLRNKKIPNKRKVYKEFKKLYPQKNEAYQQELENIKIEIADQEVVVAFDQIKKVGNKKINLKPKKTFLLQRHLNFICLKTSIKLN